MNKYSYHHKTLDTHKLVKILEESIKYEADAVESAKLELLSRNFSNEDVDMLINGRLIDLDKDEDDPNEEVHPEFEKDSLFETLDTYSESLIEEGDYKKWRYLFFFILISCAYYFYSSWPYYLYILEFGFERYYAGFSNVLIDFIFVLGLFYFWQKVRKGWILLGAIYASECIIWIHFFIETLFQPTQLYSLQTYFIYVIQALISAGLVWILFQPFIIRIYNIRQNEKIRLVIIAIAISIFYVIASRIGW